METGAAMAKKKRAPKEMVVAIRGSAEWKAWLDGFAEFARQTRVSLIDVALEEYAVKKGYKVPPRR